MTAWVVITRVITGQRWSEYYFIKYGHVAYQNIGIWGEECQIRGQFRSGSGHDRLGGHY